MRNVRKRSSFVMAVVLLLSVLGAGALNGGCLTAEAASKPVVKKVASVNSLTGNKTITLAKGKKAVLKTTVTVTPNIAANKKVSYKSSNKKIATVTGKGVITGKKPGTAKITVTSAKDKKKKATVTVKVVKGKVTSIRFSKASGMLTAGKTQKLKPVVKVSAGGSKAVAWTSSNKKVATVNKSGTVKGVAKGTAVITAKAADGSGKKATYKVTVKNDPNSLSFAKNTVSTLYITEHAEIRVICGSSKHGKVSWKSSNYSIVDVLPNGDDRGVVFGEGVGTATITATVDGKSISRKITVKDYEPKYNYEVNFLNAPYSLLDNIMYIKTDNPSDDGFRVELYDTSGKKVGIVNIFAGDYDDLKFVENNVYSAYMPIKGGYLAVIQIKETGKLKVKVKENLQRMPIYIDKGYIDVKDYQKEKEAWMQSVINQTTTASMTKKEKMTAIETYMRENSLYTKTATDGSGYINLAAETGVPFWKLPKYELNSYDSPALLVQFGEMINYPLKNLYYQYEIGTPEWRMYHSRAESIEDGTQYFFCHSEDNRIDKSTIRQIDLSQWNYYKCYR